MIKLKPYSSYLNPLDEAFEKTFEIFIDLFGIENGKVVKILNHSTRRFRRLECRGGGACEPFTVLHLTFIDFAKYFIVVRFSDLENINQRYHIKNVRFHVSPILRMKSNE